jgi:S1-C subfamily serine protease
MDPLKTLRTAITVLVMTAAVIAAAVFLASLPGEGEHAGPGRDVADSASIRTAESSPGNITDREEAWRQEPDEHGGLNAETTPFESPFVAVANRLKPSVVNITVEKEADLGQFHDFDDWFPFRDMPPQRVTTGGSGVILDERGRVVTNHHVVDGAESIIVLLDGGEEREATLIGADPETDLALLDIGDVPSSMAATLGNSDEIEIGDWAVAMGNPMGLDWTLTVGVISAVGRSDLLISGGGPVFQDFIQTDASINFGNSGGPLANIRGEVIGINAAVNTSAQGIGFAIPINMTREVVAQLLDEGVVRRGYLGMVPVELDPLKREALGLGEFVRGIFVESVSGGTPADEGGLQGSDVIIEIDGRAVSDVTDFRLRVARHKPGSELELTVLRDGERVMLDFTLADRSAFVRSAQRDESPQRVAPWMGLTVAGLDDPRAGDLNFDVHAGLLVVDVESGSPADGKLQQGDVIVEIDDDRVDDMETYREVISDLRGTDRAVLVKYHRQGRGNSRFVALKR